MRRFLLPVIGVIVLTPFVNLRGDEAADLQAIVDKAVKAAGGVEVLEKFQKQKGKQEGTFTEWARGCLLPPRSPRRPPTDFAWK